jgi:hypothetical protein
MRLRGKVLNAIGLAGKIGLSWGFAPAKSSGIKTYM